MTPPDLDGDPNEGKRRTPEHYRSAACWVCFWPALALPALRAGSKIEAPIEAGTTMAI